MTDDFIDIFCISIITILLILIFPLIFVIVESISNLYQYECVTLDNETITCDNVKTTEGGIIGTRDDTSYLIKQYKKIKKEVENNGQEK